MLELALGSVGTAVLLGPGGAVLGFVESAVNEGVAQVAGAVGVHAAGAVGTVAVLPVLADL